jgi:hypothetical protein
MLMNRFQLYCQLQRAPLNTGERDGACVRAPRELQVQLRFVVVRGRGLHSFTFRLNVSALCGTGGALTSSMGGV